jgi:hypothetical protein
MATFEEVVKLVRQQTGSPGPITRATSLQADLAVYGDDMDDLLAAYAKRFGVNLSGYLWYFHTGEEGWNIGGLIFPPPNARVRQMPITVGMLHDFAQLGRWGLEYPAHERPQSRPDLLVNQLLIMGAIGTAVVLAVGWCFS